MPKSETTTSRRRSLRLESKNPEYKPIEPKAKPRKSAGATRKMKTSQATAHAILFDMDGTLLGLLTDLQYPAELIPCRLYTCCGSHLGQYSGEVQLGPDRGAQMWADCL